jgi:hypothetical protein
MRECTLSRIRDDVSNLSLRSFSIVRLNEVTLLLNSLSTKLLDHVKRKNQPSVAFTGETQTNLSFLRILAERISAAAGIPLTIDIHQEYDFPGVESLGEPFWCIAANPAQPCHAKERLLGEPDAVTLGGEMLQDQLDLGESLRSR